MRLHQTLFLSCAAAAIVATIWYMSSINSFDRIKWSDEITPAPTSTPLSDTETQLDRLLEVIHNKESEMEGKDKQIADLELQRQKDIADEEAKIKQVQEEAAAEIKKQQDAVAAEKKKQEEEELKSQTEAEKKKKAEEEKKKELQKEEEERNRLSDAFWLIREKMSEKEAQILQPVQIPPEDRHKYVDENDKLVPNGNKILLLSAFDYKADDANNLTSKVMSNRKEYCDYHGYTNFFINTTRYKRDDELKRPAVWWKLTALRETFSKFPEAEWIWWVDYDIIITNELIDLAEHLLNPYVLAQRLTYGSPVNSLGDRFNGLRVPDRESVDISKIDIIFTQDFFGINAGSFFIRRSAFTDFLLDMWEDPFFIHQRYLREEQDAFIYLFQNHKIVFEHTGIVPQRTMNGYHNYKVKTGNWQEGDLAIHFAGPSTKRGQPFLDAFASYWKARKRVPEKYQVEE